MLFKIKDNVDLAILLLLLPLLKLLLKSNLLMGYKNSLNNNLYLVLNLMEMLDVMGDLVMLP